MKSQFGEELAAFGGGVVVVLGNGEVKGFVKPAAGVIAAGELEAGVAEQEAGHEPVSAAGGAFLEVLDGFGGVALLKEGLTEAEAEKEIARLGKNAIAKSGGAHDETGADAARRIKQPELEEDGDGGDVVGATALVGDMDKAFDEFFGAVVEPDLLGKFV